MNNQVILKLNRLYCPKSKCTIGTLVMDNEFVCFTLEDYRDLSSGDKVFGETRIPAGIYPIKFRKVLSNKTKRYRKRYDWFSWHLQVCGVPEFENVYIHIGNTAGNTDGCILVGTGHNTGTPSISSSRLIYEPLYKKISSYIESGIDVYLTISGV